MGDNLANLNILDKKLKYEESNHKGYVKKRFSTRMYTIKKLDLNSFVLLQSGAEVLPKLKT